MQNVHSLATLAGNGAATNAGFQAFSGPGFVSGGSAGVSRLIPAATGGSTTGVVTTETALGAGVTAAADTTYAVEAGVNFGAATSTLAETAAIGEAAAAGAAVGEFFTPLGGVIGAGIAGTVAAAMNYHRMTPAARTQFWDNVQLATGMPLGSWSAYHTAPASSHHSAQASPTPAVQPRVAHHPSLNVRTFSTAFPDEKDGIQSNRTRPRLRGPTTRVTRPRSWSDGGRRVRRRGAGPPTPPRTPSTSRPRERESFRRNVRPRTMDTRVSRSGGGRPTPPRAPRRRTSRSTRYRLPYTGVQYRVQRRRPGVITPWIHINEDVRVLRDQFY